MHFFAYSQEMHPASWNRPASAASSPAVPEVDVISMGRRVRHLRKAAGLTLDDLSTTVGTAPSQLSLIENGKREPKLGLPQQLAAAPERTLLADLRRDDVLATKVSAHLLLVDGKDLPAELVALAVLALPVELEVLGSDGGGRRHGVGRPLP